MTDAPKRRVRPIRVDGDLAYVPLTQGHEALIDAADVPLVSDYNWYAAQDRFTFYAIRKSGGKGSQKTIRMHRVIMGEPDGLEVDHKDGNGLNNCRCNLRKATRSQNQQNRKNGKKSVTGIRGVDFYKRTGKFRARIKVNGVINHLGMFDTPEEAYKKYLEASSKMHVDFGSAP